VIGLLPVAILGTPDGVVRIAATEGYSDEVDQTQAGPNAPVVRHPAPYTGGDVMLELHDVEERSDHDLRIEGRGQHYEPLDGYHVTDDGTLNVGFTNGWKATHVDTLRLNAFATLTKFNTARLTDAVVYQFDPTQLDSTFTLIDLSAGLIHEFSPTWRMTETVNYAESYTFSEPAIALTNGQLLHHRGLDYVQPVSVTEVLHDWDPRNLGELRFVYQYTYAPVVYDVVNNAAVNVGPVSTEIGTLTLGEGHQFTEALRTFSRFGATVAGSLGPDRPVLGPSVDQEIWYVKPDWSAHAALGYAYASFIPRFGAGPTFTADASLLGAPFPGALRNLSLLLTVRGSYASLSTALAVNSEVPGPVRVSSTLDGIGASAQVRFALNPLVGVLAGYDLHYATFAGGTEFPPLLRNTVYLGVQAFLSSDRSLPALTTFVPAVPQQ